MEQLNHFIEFTDGSLANDAEQKLFFDLASDESLRNEFRRHLAVKSAIGSSVNMFTPDPSSAMSIFSKIGLDYPVNNPNITPLSLNTGSEIINNSNFFKTFFTRKYMISSLLSACIGGLIVYLLMLNSTSSVQNQLAENNKNIQNLNNKISKLNSENDKLSKNQNNLENSLVSSRMESDKISNENSNMKSKISDLRKENKNYSIAKLNNHEASDSPKLINNTTTPEIKISENLNTPKENIYISNFSSNHTPVTVYQEISTQPLIQKLMNILSSSENGEYPKWGFELKGGNYWNNPDGGLPSKSANFSNTSIGFLYNFNKNFSLITDFRQETFFLKFSGKSEDHRIYQYQMQPNLISGNIGFRAKFEVSSLIIPFFQSTAGINEYGWVERGMIGLELAPYKNMSMIFGSELNWMQFQSKGNLFETRKSGFHYGFSYKF